MWGGGGGHAAAEHSLMFVPVDDYIEIGHTITRTGRTDSRACEAEFATATTENAYQVCMCARTDRNDGSSQLHTKPHKSSKLNLQNTA